MDLYHVYCDLKPGVSDMAFAEAVGGWLGHLQTDGLIAGWRLTRAKLGFGARGMGDFHIIIEVRDLHQLEDAFQRTATRRGLDEVLHGCVNQMTTNTTFALYRDFPDAVRVVGEEKF